MTMRSPLACLLATALLGLVSFGAAAANANDAATRPGEPLFVIPESARLEAAARGHDHRATTPRALSKGGGYTIVEDFDCPSGNCLYALSANLQKTTYAPVGQGCAGTTTFISRGGVTSTWYDALDNPFGFPDATGNGNGSQRLTTNLLGYKNAGCDSVLEFHVLFRDYTAGAFSGSAMRVHYYPELSAKTVGAEPPRVYIQVDYAESGPSLNFVDSHSYNGWNTVSMDIDPDFTVNQVIIAVGGPTTWDAAFHFDDLEVYDYVGPSTSCATVPKSVNFGSTLFPGQTSQRTFDVINTATEGTLFINPTASGCDEFSVTGGQGATYLEPGQSHKITVSFSPESPGVYECEIDLGNPACEPFLVTGGTRAECELPEDPIDFGDQIVGAPAKLLSFYLKNEGGSTFDYPGAEPLQCTGFDYETTPAPGPVAPGDSIQFIVSFAPPDTGLYTCEASIVDDCDPVTFTGRGQPDLPCVFVPDTLDFGEVELGDTAKLDFTIENRSYGTTIGGSFADCQGLFQFLDGRSYSLQPGESTVMTVSYVPTTVRNDTCTLQIGHPTCPFLTFIGSGNQDAVCSLNRTAYDFGLVSGNGSPGIFDLVMQNTGGRVLTGTIPESCGPFRVVGGPVDYSLGFSEITTVRFEFMPVENGPVSCEYPLGNDCDSLSLSGIGRICEVFDLDIDYGDVLVGDTLENAFTVRNYSDGPMSFSLPSACGAFTIDPDDRDFELQPGFGREVSVLFAPDTLGFFACTIPTGPECDSVRVSGTGIGTPLCRVEPASLDFGTIPDGGLTERTFTITNDGTATLAVIVPAACDVFTVTGAGAVELEPGEDATFAVVFGNIDTPGQYTCALDLGGAEGCGSLSLTGVAEGPPVCSVSPPDIAFGLVDIGETAEETFTITNSGGGVLSGTVASGCGPFTVVEADRSYALAGGESETFTVRFSPDEGGSEICALPLGGACGSIDIAGNGNEFCSVTIESPAAGDSLVEGQSAVIAWTSRFCEGDLVLELFAGGGVCEPIGSAPVADGAFSWDVSACEGETGEYRVRVTSDDSFVYQSAPFTIVPGADLALSDDAIDFTFDPLNPEQALASDLTITNDGTGPLAWSAEPGHPAIQLAFTSGTIAPGNSFELPVVVDPDEIDGDELTGEITLYTNDPSLPVTTISVSLAVRQYQTGDVDVDDDIDLVDLAALVEHVLERALLFPLIVEIGIPDVNGDGLVDVSDIVRHARILLAGNVDRPGIGVAGAPDLTARRSGDGVIEVVTGGANPGAIWLVLREGDGSARDASGAVTAKRTGTVTPGAGYALFSETREGVTTLLLVPDGSEPSAHAGPGDFAARSQNVALLWEAAPAGAGIDGFYVERTGREWRSGGIDATALGATPTARAFELAPAEPNPFRGRTTVRWSRSTAGRLSLVVYDIAGRRVRSLLDGHRAAGAGATVWDGLNDAGNEVPPGTYFIRGESAGQAVTRKIVLFR